jgi:S-adenosylmethionine synthetase
MPIQLAHRLAMRLSEVRKRKLQGVDFLRPDGKTQVSVEYRKGKPVRIDNVVVSSQHTPEVTYDEIVDGIKREVIAKVMPADMMDENTRIYINTTGRFVAGGPLADCGLTGRKIINDTYGGMGNHGGGAFSGKDPSKVDRSASYMARYIAKNCVAAGLAERLVIQLAYAIGVAEPVSVMVDTFGTGRLSDDEITRLIREHFQLTPRGIIESLDLRRPIFRKTAAYGHFGRENEGFTWERTDKAEALRRDADLSLSDVQSIAG